jgi:hypothetical protein
LRSQPTLSGLPGVLAARLNVASLTAAEFTQAAIEAVRVALPESRCWVDAELSLGVQGAAGTTMVSLQQSFEQPPLERAAWAWHALTTVRDAFGNAGQGRADQIVPLVRPAATWAEAAVVEPLTPGLDVVYAFNQGNSFNGVQTADLSRLALERSGLRALALANLRRELPPLQRRGSDGLWMLLNPGSGGYFEASLLLLDEVWAQLASEVKGEVVVAVPTRDLLFVTGSEDAAGLERVKEIVADALSRPQQHALTNQLYVRRAGGWQPR